MEASLFPQPCRLLSLPTEVKLHIVDFLDNRRDLYNLSQTCRVLEDMVMARLYHTIDFELDQSRKATFRKPVTQSVREFTMRNGRIQRRNSMHKRRRISDAGSFSAAVNGLLEKIPANQLTRFEFFHQRPMSPQVLDFLARRHGNTLQHLSFYDLESGQQSLVPEALSVLDARTVNEGDAVEKIISANKRTLQCLSLGQEKQLIERYQHNRLGLYNQIPQPRESFLTSAYALDSFPQLRELSLSGLDVGLLRPASMSQARFFCRLERLALESCPGSIELLESIASTFHWTATSPEAPQTPQATPSLKHFLFRHENPTAALKDATVRFLTSFTGLRTLSLLFENAAILERPSTFIAEHGPTLETLVFESRIQPREHLTMDTSRPFGVGGYSHDLWEDSINDIARLCPNLVELGMGFPWTDEMVRLRKTALPTLQHLKTIHVRNFPENQTLSQLGDYTIKEYAIKFVEWVFPARVGGPRPALTHLAIGPTIYESRWNITPQSEPTTMSANTSTTHTTCPMPVFNTSTYRPTPPRPQAHPATRSQPPEFLRTHHFCLDWAKTRFNRWSPLITPVSERFMEEISGQKPLRGVFEQVWLR
ncbi:hypothetical protein A1O7_02240 [Cladophialophora yegresii CBS 114405]|uniref:F-box domain-containing protein n=1 Tax=Cladophialophora yegresii CBS 114405 TaxID=1182544 RepID=W9W9X2_9EURO|nr:uncharacterized protein A1O7_02240 [Cladophialophora yegresii CBS 114405]EXJ61810.1 hypothetical protein A1O7_02240 [Cladophialophora yegresii CBS 114405]